jgi:hypothetical protein
MNSISWFVGILSYSEAFVSFAFFYVLLGESIHNHLRNYILSSIILGTIVSIMKWLEVSQGITLLVSLAVLLGLMLLLFKRTWWKLALVFLINFSTIVFSDILIAAIYSNIMNLTPTELKETNHIHFAVVIILIIRIFILLALRYFKFLIFQEEPSPNQAINSNE